MGNTFTKLTTGGGGGTQLYKHTFSGKTYGGELDADLVVITNSPTPFNLNDFDVEALSVYFVVDMLGDIMVLQNCVYSQGITPVNVAWHKFSVSNDTVTVVFDSQKFTNISADVVTPL